jgi:hypothetical protein
LEISKNTGLELQISLFRGRGSADLVEKFGKSNTWIVQQAIRLRCFRKHKVKDHKGKEERGGGGGEGEGKEGEEDKYLFASVSRSSGSSGVENKTRQDTSINVII